jgi:hypothetical protein
VDSAGQSGNIQTLRVITSEDIPRQQLFETFRNAERLAAVAGLHGTQDSNPALPIRELTQPAPPNFNKLLRFKMSFLFLVSMN